MRDMVCIRVLVEGPMYMKSSNYR